METRYQAGPQSPLWKQVVGVNNERPLSGVVDRLMTKKHAIINTSSLIPGVVDHHFRHAHNVFPDSYLYWTSLLCEDDCSERIKVRWFRFIVEPLTIMWLYGQSVLCCPLSVFLFICLSVCLCHISTTQEQMFTSWFLWGWQKYSWLQINKFIDVKFDSSRSPRQTNYTFYSFHS